MCLCNLHGCLLLNFIPCSYSKLEFVLLEVWFLIISFQGPGAHNSMPERTGRLARWKHRSSFCLQTDFGWPQDEATLCFCNCLTSKWHHTLLLKMSCESKFTFRGPCHSQLHRLASRQARGHKANFLIWNFTMGRHRYLRRKNWKNGGHTAQTVKATEPPGLGPVFCYKRDPPREFHLVLFNLHMRNDLTQKNNLAEIVNNQVDKTKISIWDPVDRKWPWVSIFFSPAKDVASLLLQILTYGKNVKKCPSVVFASNSEPLTMATWANKVLMAAAGSNVFGLSLQPAGRPCEFESDTCCWPSGKFPLRARCLSDVNSLMQVNTNIYIYNVLYDIYI